MKKFTLLFIYPLLLMGVFLVFSRSSCKKEEPSVEPTLITAAVTSITTTTASSGGNITDDGGASVTSRGVCWSTSQNPTVADSHTDDGNGTGTFISSITGLTSNTTYYTRAYATNSAGTGYGGQYIIKTATGTVNDIDGNTYYTVTIGTQVWMKENLNVGTMIQGNQEMTDNGVIEKYCYNNEPDSCTKYGGLYQWNEMMQYTSNQGSQGICPPGWHIPTDEEWNVLEGAVDSKYGIGDPEWDFSNELRGYDAGLNLKTTSGWSKQGNGIDKYGFSGLPGGGRDGDGNFLLVGETGFWWTSTEIDSNYAWDHDFVNDTPEVYRYLDTKVDGLSVRCLRDD